MSGAAAFPGLLVAAADGSSLRNPGPAGWAWFVDSDRWAAGGWPHATNNQGELMAVLDLLRQSRGLGVPVRILCDSQYAINVCTTWLPAWKARGWRKADKKPILNLDLIQYLDAELKDRDVSFEWVKGHAGHPLNERADALARAAAEAFQRGARPNAGPGLGRVAPAVPASGSVTPPSPPTDRAAPVHGPGTASPPEAPPVGRAAPVAARPPAARPPLNDQPALFD